MHIMENLALFSFISIMKLRDKNEMWIQSCISEQSLHTFYYITVIYLKALPTNSYLMTAKRWSDRGEMVINNLIKLLSSLELQA